MSAERSGWAWPGAAKKAHYFHAAPVSLCGKWMFTGSLAFSQEGTSPDDCVACTRKLEKLSAAQVVSR